MTDYIKREDAQDITAEWLSGYINDEQREVLENVEVELGELPSADVVDKAEYERVYKMLKNAEVALTGIRDEVEVEVVRCKDCVHYNEYDNGEKIIDDEEVHDGWCMRWSGIEDVNRHDYCSYGERVEA